MEENNDRINLPLFIIVGFGTNMMRIQFSDSKQLLEICKKTVESLKLDGEHHSPVPAILTTAITLEAILNDAMVSGASDIFPYEEQNRMANSLSSMSFKGKLDIAATLVSNNEYCLLSESNLYQNLIKLIKIRNSLAHNKGYSRELNPDDLVKDLINEPDAFKNAFESAAQKHNSKPLYTLTLSDAENYLESVTQLHDLLTNKNCDFHKYPNIFKSVLI